MKICKKIVFEFCFPVENETFFFLCIAALWIINTQSSPRQIGLKKQERVQKYLDAWHFLAIYVDM